MRRGPDTIVSADATQHTVFIPWQFRKFSTLSGDMNRLCCMRYAVEPHFMTESISFMQASTYKGTCIAKTLSAAAPITGHRAFA